MKIKLCKPRSGRFLTALLVMLSPGLTHAQSLLDNYIHEGLDGNLVLQEKNLSLEQAEKSLQIARSYFLPSIDLLADYTSGEGGRSISFPAGDLLNPVYATLNEMTQNDAFPQIENVTENFFPKNFYDVKIRTSLPLINTDLRLNRSVQSQEVMMKQYELEGYRRQLVMDIKTAYYNILSAKAAVKIYESALTLITKNVEINESLLANGKSLPANLIRSKSELERVKAELTSAHNQEANAKKYFNFLLNRDLAAEVPVDSSTENDAVDKVDESSAETTEREEIKMLKTVQEINETSVKMKQLNRIPKVNAFLDIGSQAYNWQVNEDSRYYLVGVQLSLPLFQGFRNNLSIRQGELEIEKTQKQILQTNRKLELAADIARNDLLTARQNYVAAKEQLKSAQSYFRLIERGYREGVNALIEFIDARNQLTTSQLQRNLRQFEMRVAEARLERETASYTFEH
ncbi:MAG TPA: TolC family protein [Cyclobacteriaceae bacterium]